MSTEPKRTGYRNQIARLVGLLALLLAFLAALVTPGLPKIYAKSPPPLIASALLDHTVPAGEYLSAGFLLRNFPCVDQDNNNDCDYRDKFTSVIYRFDILSRSGDTSPDICEGQGLNRDRTFAPAFYNSSRTLSAIPLRLKRECPTGPYTLQLTVTYAESDSNEKVTLTDKVDFDVGDPQPPTATQTPNPPRLRLRPQLRRHRTRSCQPSAHCPYSYAAFGVQAADCHGYGHSYAAKSEAPPPQPRPSYSYAGAESEAADRHPHGYGHSYACAESEAAPRHSHAYGHCHAAAESPAANRPAQPHTDQNARRTAGQQADERTANPHAYIAVGFALHCAPSGHAGAGLPQQDRRASLHLRGQQHGFQWPDVRFDQRNGVRLSIRPCAARSGTLPRYQQRNRQGGSRRLSYLQPPAARLDLLCR